MGTTSEKLTYLNNTKQELKQKINNLGGSIDDNTTFRQYANQLQNVYDNLPKTEYQEGTEINLGKTIKGKLDYENGVVGIGQSSQDTTEGYNLLPNELQSQSINELTVTRYEDGSFKINGTASKNTNLYFVQNGDKELPSGTYTIALIGKTNQLGMYFYKGAGTENRVTYMPISSTIETGSFTISETTRMLNIYVYIASGSVFNNDIFKPMIYSGTTTKSYEPYTNGASPNPSYPQEIKCVRGKNLLDESTWEIGSIDATTGQNAVGPIEFRTSGYIEVNGSVTLSNYNYLDYTYRGIFEYDSNKNYIKRTNDNIVSKTTPFTLNLASNTRYIRIRYIVGTTVISIPTNMQIQLEEGPATPYLPYNTIEEVVSGINDCDLSQVEIGKAWNNASNTARAVCYMNLKPNMTYTISATGYDVFDDSLFRWFEKTSKEATAQNASYDLNSSVLPKTITTKTNSGAFLLQFNKTDISTSDFANVKIQVQEGPATPYEPYITPTSYQLSLGNLELFKIVRNSSSILIDKIIKINGKFYKEKNVGKVEVDSTLNPSISLASTNTARVVFSNLLANNPPMTISGAIGYSNYFKQNANWGTDAEGFFYDAGNYALWFRGNKSTIGATEEAVLSWVHTNKPYFIYPLATPVLEEITDETLISQLNAWYNAHSLNGTTIITSNGNLPMIIKVRGLKGE